MSDTFIWTIIIGMAVVNFAVRFTPIAIVSRIDLPDPLMRWLSFIPISVMGALVAGEVFRPGGETLPPLTNPYLIAAIPTALVYYKTRSLLGSVIVGVIVFVTLRAVGIG